MSKSFQLALFTGHAWGAETSQEQIWEVENKELR